MSERSPARIVLFVVGAVFLWWAVLSRMSSSLWLDELGTYWVIEDGIGEVVARAARYHGQTPLYYAVVWGLTRIFGSSEVLLRLPSLAGVVGAVWITARLAGRMFGRAAILPAAVIMAVLPNLVTAATDARPYGLGLLTVAVATYAFYAWVEIPTWRRALVYAVASALTVYVHYMLAIAIVGHAVAFVGIQFGRSGDDAARRYRQAAGAAAAFGMLVLPTVPQVLELLGRTAELLIPFNPTPPEFLLRGLGLVVVLPPLAAAVLLGARSGSDEPPGPPPLRERWWVAAAGALTPVTILLLVGLFSDIVLWQDRYTLAGLPGVALTVSGLLVRRVAGVEARRIVLVAVLVVGLLSVPRADHHGEDWRAALAAAADLSDDGSAMWLASGYIESSRPEFVADARNRAYLNAPVAYYWPGADPEPLPYSHPRTDLEVRVAAGLPAPIGADHVVYVGGRPGGADLGLALEAVLEREGFRRVGAAAYGAIVVFEFDR